jgi:hypothetical protein
MDKRECNPSSCNLGIDGPVIRDHQVELRRRRQAAFLLLGWTSAYLVLADTAAEVENRRTPKISQVDSSMFSLRQDPGGIDTAAGGRSGAKRCGPSRRRVQNTRASLKNLTGQSKKTFSTLSRDELQIRGQ